MLRVREACQDGVLDRTDAHHPGHVRRHPCHSLHARISTLQHIHTVQVYFFENPNVFHYYAFGKIKNNIFSIEFNLY